MDGTNQHRFVAFFIRVFQQTRAKSHVGAGFLVPSSCRNSWNVQETFKQKVHRAVQQFLGVFL